MDVTLDAIRRKECRVHVSALDLIRLQLTYLYQWNTWVLGLGFGVQDLFHPNVLPIWEPGVIVAYLVTVVRPPVWHIPSIRLSSLSGKY